VASHRPGIYGPGTGPLVKARTADKLLVKPGHVFCRVFVDDVCGALLASMARPNPGRVYNVCDDEPAPSHLVSLYACELLNVAPPPLVAFDGADVSPTLKSFYAESRRVNNVRLRAELGFAPAYPSYRQGLAEQMAREATLAQTAAEPRGAAAAPWRPAPPRLLQWLLRSLVARVWRLLVALYRRWRFAGANVVLIDNGSLRPGSTLGMRRIASLLATRVGAPVRVLSVRFSDRIDAAKLNGERAQVVSPATLQGRVLVAPMFLGPSEAIGKDVAQHMRAVGSTGRILPPLVRADETFADCLVTACLARAALALRLSEPFRVVLVDHGSPVRAVSDMRRALAARLRLFLGARAAVVVDCSMERRPGPEFAFNEPLLENVFDLGGLDSGPVAVLPAFLFAGNHAGPGGDVQAILHACTKRHPALDIRMAALVCDEVNDDLVVDLLVRRVRGFYDVADF